MHNNPFNSVTLMLLLVGYSGTLGLLLVTESDRTPVRQEYHLGMNRTMELVCKKYNWPCMTKDITSYVSQ